MFFIFIFILNCNSAHARNKPLILDMDFSTDVDDVCALRLATTLHKEGKIDLKAVMLCVTGENNLAAANGLLEHDGVKNIPIGKSSKDIPDSSPYWNILAKYSKSNFEIIDSVQLYRSILVKSKLPITIVTTGYLTNIAELMKSPSDEISDKTGMELIKENTDKIIITGGSYPEGLENNFFYCKEAREALSYILKNYDGNLYFVQNNTGGPVKCGAVLQNNDQYTDDPVKLSLEAYGAINGHAAWDPMSVWIASSASFEECGVDIESVDVQFDVKTGVNKFSPSTKSGLFRVFRTSDDLEYYSVELDKLVICK